MGKVFQYVVRVNGKEYNVEIESENEEIFLKSKHVGKKVLRRQSQRLLLQALQHLLLLAHLKSLLLQLRLVVQWWRLRYQVRFSESTCQREVR